MTLSLTSSIPLMFKYTTPPTDSVDECNQAQLLLDSSDVDPNSSGLYFLKSGSIGSQDWKRLATTEEVNAVSPPTRIQSAVSRSLNSIFQISTTRDSFVNYSVDIQTAISLLAGQAGTVFLEISLSSTFASGIQEVARFLNSCTGTLTVGLALNQIVTGNLNGYVPAGYYVRLRTANNTGTPTFTYRSGQEVIM
jgi:hypothetical protein